LKLIGSLASTTSLLSDHVCPLARCNCQRRNATNATPGPPQKVPRRCNAGTQDPLRGREKVLLVPRGFFRGEINESRYKIFFEKKNQEKGFFSRFESRQV